MNDPYKLTLDRIMYSKTYGWTVWKNGSLFYKSLPIVDMADCKPLLFFDKLAKVGEAWEARYSTAEKVDIYKRVEKGNWVFDRTEKSSHMKDKCPCCEKPGTGCQTVGQAGNCPNNPKSNEKSRG